jgi:hypothetical protein
MRARFAAATTRGRWLRAVMVLVGLAHSLPASKHLALFLGSPSLAEAWKGFGALAAMAIYLLASPSAVAAALLAVHRRSPRALSVAGLLLAAAHAVPALDHVPAFLAHPSFADGWRGFGSLAAALWFIAPLPAQARALGALRATIARLEVRGAPTAAQPAVPDAT